LFWIKDRDLIQLTVLTDINNYEFWCFDNLVFRKNIISISRFYRDFDEKSYYFPQKEELKKKTIFKLPSTLCAGITNGVKVVIKIIKDKRKSI
jgi:hypothetical protein